MAVKVDLGYDSPANRDRLRNKALEWAKSPKPIDIGDGVIGRARCVKTETSAGNLPIITIEYIVLLAPDSISEVE